MLWSDIMDKNLDIFLSKVSFDRFQLWSFLDKLWAWGLVFVAFPIFLLDAIAWRFNYER